VEFALILPVLAMMLLMIIDFGRVFSMQIALANAAREGAHFCALHQGAVDKTAGTLARVRGELDGRVTADLDALGCPAVGFGLPVTVTVRATFTPITPFVSNLAGGPITLQTAATMEVW
jgi:Flp pilus assembly protein TadG